MDERILVKLGGSVITDKSATGVVNRDRLAFAARIIAERPGSVSLLVHGAGSCGHPQARAGGLDRGLDPARLRSVHDTHRAVSGLNAAVVSALRSEGVEAIGIHPLGMCTAEGGRIAGCEVGHIGLMIENGILPVLHGDVVMDRVRGASILSGDQLSVYLALKLGISRIGMATSVPGVMDGEKVIRRLDRSMVCGVPLGGSGTIDVTGGMRGKVAELIALADRGCESHIFHISRLADFLDGRDHGGTVVTGA
ncbi:MAG: isopentenyl phosphate kinase [Methanoculleaceae archaeon]